MQWTALAILGPALFRAPPPLAAQGVTGAAIEGRVISVDSTPLEQAIVQVTNTSNGERWQTTTSARGRYFLEYLSVGGPYRIEVRAVGHTPARRDSLRLRLGQRLAADFMLTPAAVQLQEISVTGAPDPRLSADRTGPAQIISDSTIARLPVPGRDFTELAILAPQVTKSPSINGGLSFAGQHDRYNSIRVDGIGNNDPFGRIQSGNGLAGWGPGVRALTPEAIEELQIVSAPFDVRYGDFAGGLINAVTKSGSNQIEGSIVGYFESDELNQKDVTGSQGPDFGRKELGLTLGAPIVRDRLALFANAAMTQEVFPQEVPATSNDSLYESLLRFQDLLEGYGVDPGDISEGPFRARSLNLLVKVKAQLGVNSRLEVSHEHRDGATRDETPLLSSSFVPGWETINATRLAWTTAFGGRFSNELTLARVDDSRACVPISELPGVSVPTRHGDLYAGVEGSVSPCAEREAGHTTWEFTGNFGLAAGSHRLTFGAHGERIDLVENPGLATRGLWSFENLDSLESGAPLAYFRNSPNVADTQVVFRVNQIGFYLQDQWLPSPRLTLTAGLRLDVPFVPEEPPRNAAAWDEMGINTALTPSGNPLWSPRLGVNYDLSGRGTTRVRGGAGLFAGHPPLVWFRNVYGFNAPWNTTLDCSGSDVPAFTLDSKNQPTACGDGSPPTWNPVFFDPDFHFPQTLKLALGADHLLPWGIVGTLDFLYTRSVYAAHTVDVNHRLVGTAAGEGGRAMYGAIDPETGEVEKRRRFPALAEVYQLRNGGGDRSYSITAQLGKRFPNGTEVSLAYTYEDAKDRMSMEWNFPSDQEASTPVNGTLEDRELSDSYWERPHKITLVATTDLPLGFRFGFTYIGMSATAYTHLVDGDANADGYEGNDPVYVPRDVRPGGDVALAVNDGTDHFVPAPDSVYVALDRQIQADPCLRHQRGRVLVRNSCRDPWGHETTARLSKRFRLANRRGLEVTADLFNVLSFLGSDWGVGPYPNQFGGLRLVGYDTANGRGVYEAGKVEQYERDPGAWRWHMQLGATLTF